jgi:hypothetical protein
MIASGRAQGQIGSAVSVITLGFWPHRGAQVAIAVGLASTTMVSLRGQVMRLSRAGPMRCSIWRPDVGAAGHRRGGGAGHARPVGPRCGLQAMSRA